MCVEHFMSVFIESLRNVNDAAHKLAFDTVIRPFVSNLASVPSLPVWLSLSWSGVMLLLNSQVWSSNVAASSVSLAPSSYISQVQFRIVFVMSLALYFDIYSRLASCYCCFHNNWSCSLFKFVASGNVHVFIHWDLYTTGLINCRYCSQWDKAPLLLQAIQWYWCLYEAYIVLIINLPTASAVDKWLSSVSNAAMEALIEKILAIPVLTPVGAKQLGADIGSWWRP